MVKRVFFNVTQQPNAGVGRLIVEVCISHTSGHTHTRQDSSERVISSSLRPLTTQQTINTSD